MEGGHPIAERSWSQDFIFKGCLRKEFTDSGELLPSVDLTKLSSVMDGTEDILLNRIGRAAQLRAAHVSRRRNHHRNNNSCLHALNTLRHVCLSLEHNTRRLVTALSSLFCFAGG